MAMIDVVLRLSAKAGRCCVIGFVFTGILSLWVCFLATTSFDPTYLTILACAAVLGLLPCLLVSAVCIRTRQWMAGGSFVQTPEILKPTFTGFLWGTLTLGAVCTIAMLASLAVVLSREMLLADMMAALCESTAVYFRDGGVVNSLISGSQWCVIYWMLTTAINIHREELGRATVA